LSLFRHAAATWAVTTSTLVTATLAQVDSPQPRL